MTNDCRLSIVDCRLSNDCRFNTLNVRKQTVLTDRPGEDDVMACNLKSICCLSLLVNLAQFICSEQYVSSSSPQSLGLRSCATLLAKTEWLLNIRDLSDKLFFKSIK